MLVKNISMKTLALASLAACAPLDETLTAYAQGETVFRLSAINEMPVKNHTTMDIGTAGQISGTGPCNRYSATQTVPYPWFNLGPIAATKIACENLAEEQLFFAMLSDMSLVEILGGTLILSNTDGDQMVFQSP